MENQVQTIVKKRYKPPAFENPKELKEKIDEYFDICEKNDEVPLLSGLAVKLGVNRQTLANYDVKDEYFGMISIAKSKCEYALEKKLVNKETYATGQIFALKNGYGWKEQVEYKDETSNNASKEIMGAFAAMLQESARKKLVEGQVIENDE